MFMVGADCRKGCEQNGGHASGNCHVHNDVLAKSLVIEHDNHEGDKDHPSADAKKAC